MSTYRATPEDEASGFAAAFRRTELAEFGGEHSASGREIDPVFVRRARKMFLAAKQAGLDGSLS